ncbi:MAG: hypothetical protein D6706_21620, partial [Chloroflexi bacterium]
MSKKKSGLEAARSIIRAWQRDEPGNGVKPEDCGPWAEIMTEAARAFEARGLPAAMRVISVEPELIRVVAENAPGAAADLFPHYSLSTGLQLPDTEWLVYGAIAERDAGMIFGDAASGKTYLAIDLAVSLAAGLDWMNRWPVERPRRVLYFIAEGRRKFFRRVL